MPYAERIRVIGTTDPKPGDRFSVVPAQSEHEEDLAFKLNEDGSKTGFQELVEYVQQDNREKRAADMPSFTKQDRPPKVKSIYKALTREHGESMAPEVKARIAIRKGRKTKQARKPPETGGPAYKDPITHTFRGGRYVKTAAANFAKAAKCKDHYAHGGLVVPKTSKNLAKRLAGKKGAAARKAMVKKAGLFKAVTKSDPGAHRAPGKLWKLVSVLTGGQVRKPTREVAKQFAKRGL